MKRVTGSILLVLAAASFAAAGVNVGVSTPNASIYVGTPPSRPAPQVTVIERETVIVKDHGKHKGHYKQKKHKKHKKDRHDDDRD